MSRRRYRRAPQPVRSVGLPFNDSVDRTDDFLGQGEPSPLSVEDRPLSPLVHRTLWGDPWKDRPLSFPVVDWFFRGYGARSPMQALPLSRRRPGGRGDKLSAGVRSPSASAFNFRSGKAQRSKDWRVLNALPRMSRTDSTCHRRRARRAVLFAIGRSGRHGSGGTYRRTPESAYGCR